MRTHNHLGYLPQKINQNPDFPITVEEVIYSGFKKQSLFISKGDQKLIVDWLVKMQIGDLAKKANESPFRRSTTKSLFGSAL